MSLNMHGLSQHNKILKTPKFNWLCSETSKYKVKRASFRVIKRCLDDN